MKCPDCGTHEISIERTCHNSKCASYAESRTIYRGWREGLQPGEFIALPPGEGSPPVALVQFIEGLEASTGRTFTEAELRAAAHALTVKADRLACTRPQFRGA